MSFSEPSIELAISTVDLDDSEISFNTERGLKGHEKPALSILHFDSPHNKLVTCSNDSTIRIWNSITNECLTTIEKTSGRSVKDVIKMNQNVFIGCSHDCIIRSFSISSHEQIKTVKVDVAPYQLLKLNEDLFLCYCFEELLLLSYSRFEIVKEYKMGQLESTNSPLLLSRNYPNSFYVATNAKYNSIVLIDFEKDRIVKEFTGHETKFWVRALSLFKNSRNEEILIVCQTREKIYAYNTSHPKFDTNKEINQAYDYGEYNYSQGMISCCCLNNQYLFCGHDDGYVSFYDFSEQESSNGIEMIGTKKFFGNGSVQCINIIPSKGKQSIRIVASIHWFSLDTSNEISVTRVDGLRSKEEKSYEQTDLKERIHFLLHEHERIFFDEKGKDYFLEIRMEILLGVPKWILRMDVRVD